MLIKRATTEQCRRVHDERVTGWKFDRYKSRYQRLIAAPIPTRPTISNLTGTVAATTMNLTGFNAITGNCCVLTGWCEGTPAQFTIGTVTDNSAGGSNLWTLGPTARETTNNGYCWLHYSLNMSASKPTTLTVTATGTMAATAVSFWLFDINFPQPTPIIQTNFAQQIAANTRVQQCPLQPNAPALLIEAMANDNGSATIQAPWNDPGFHIITWMIAPSAGSWTPTWTQSSAVPSSVVAISLEVTPDAPPPTFAAFCPGAGSVSRGGSSINVTF